MISRTLIAAAVLSLSAAAAAAACAGNTRLAMAPVEHADEGALRPAEVEGLRRLYIGLRKTAYDRCARRHAVGAMAAKEQCFHDTLQRLVADVGDASLMRYHRYIDGIVRPSG